MRWRDFLAWLGCRLIDWGERLDEAGDSLIRAAEGPGPEMCEHGVYRWMCRKEHAL